MMVQKITSEDVRDEIYGALSYLQGNNRLEAIEDFERENKRTIIIRLTDGRKINLVVPYPEPI
jgi:hypothetical protein